MNKMAILEGLLFVVGEDGLTFEQIEDVLDITEEEAKNHPRRNVITRALGTERMIIVDIYKKDINKAVKNNKFHVYAISTIDEGIEILTGVPAGSKDTPGTINYLVYNTLKKFAKQSNQ